MRASLRLRCSILALALLATACTESLDSPTIVRTPRILAIAGEPPEAAPGEDLLVDAMISIPEDVARPLALRWLSCIDAQEVLRASGFREIELPGTPECDEQMLPEGEPYVVRGERTAELVDTLRALAAAGGFDLTTFETLLATTGLAFFVDVQVLDANGEVVVAGFKRVAMTTRETPTTNPPPPTFLFGTTMITGTGDPFDFTCAAADGVVPTVEPGAEIELVPVLPPGLDEEPWLETFPIFDFTGGLATARENAYYTWLATAGGISEFTTRPPERASEWTAPDEEGPQALWLVVRDGHLGASACRLDVVVAR
ncbi:hypothetical protein [Sandaracinus amylolyticus]|uniref:Lipoprotein n=1 Tax=Sandaracinus amylolyticus TaxID=927083 RepID=A0A0F6W8D3_9BACT|nr:hypothetical protein [Sandaracinus amylolyticus]AKF09915.1 hypothetical protein DB32_007064 [Sandaracinus amylolyticus]